MNAQKQKWINDITEAMKKFYNNVNVLFIATEQSNKFYFNENDESQFVICDFALNTETGVIVFEFFTNHEKEYRFSTKLKYFWEIDRKTKKKIKRDTNWPQIFKIAKHNFDSFNGEFNRFCLMAHFVNFEGSGNGIYGVTPGTFVALIEKSKVN